MPKKPIRLLGDPKLWKNCKAVQDPGAAGNAKIICDLRDTLADFRKKNGFGRAIAAPQIGILRRIIYVDFPKAKISGAMINPKIIKKSKTKIRLWDDCFSFPGLLVKVERAKEIVVAYLDEGGKKHSNIANGGLSELLQHEIDHLDGILAVQRALDGKSFALRSERKRI
ncbi:MAG TPA: peptide deformylase [Candidatus Binatia bacterium]|nr:peptide deformylase [Candidatus Binatia bacterium]